MDGWMDGFKPFWFLSDWDLFCISLAETTQIENPRTQWRQEQERMLKEYLVVAQEALEAKKEMYLVKQQRLELAQKEMLLFHELSEDNRSVTSGKTHWRPAVLHTQMCQVTDGQEELRMRKVWTVRSQGQLELDLSWTYYLHYTVDVLSGTGGSAFLSGEKGSIPLFFHPTLSFMHLHPVYPVTPSSCHT